MANLENREAPAISDETLAEAAKTDPEAFGQLYERHVGMIYGYLYNRTHNVEDAEDLAARTFYQALTNIRRYQARGLPISAWLFRIAHNLVTNHHRDNTRHPTTSVDTLLNLNQGPNPEEETLVSEEAAELRRAIAHLPPEKQQLLVFKFVLELPNQEIGRKMGKTMGATKALLHRTVFGLRDELTRHHVNLSIDKPEDKPLSADQQPF